MFKKLAIAGGMLFSTQQTVYGMGDGFGFSVPNFDLNEEAKKDFRKAGEAKAKAERDHQKRMDDSNNFTDEDYKQILAEKISDLKSINAILIRYKEDFRKVREQDDQNGYHTKYKVLKIFNTNIWQYVPNKNLRVLVNHLHHDYLLSDFPKSEKLFHLRNKITILKNQLIYLRDLCVRKECTPWQVFVYLYHADIRLAVYGYNKDWDEYRAVLKELDEGLN